MPRPIAEILADEYVAQGYRDLRVQQHAFELVDKIIVRLHRDLARMVRDTDPAEGATARKLEFMERRSKKMIDSAYQQASKLMDKELAEFTEMEVAHTRKALQVAFDEALEDEE